MKLPFLKNLLSTTILLLFITSSFAQTWQSVGGGTNNSSHGMVVWDNKLINLGSFNNPHNRVAAWDGTSWSALGGGVGIVARAGCVWNGKLVVVGDFWNNFQPCVGCNGVAVWDGTSWSALDNGFNNDVLTCTVHNGDLYIGGDFTQADGVACSRVVRWDDTANEFVSLGTPSSFGNDVRCMTSFQGELWVGGDFNNVDGNSPNDGLVKWDDATSTWLGGNLGVDLVGGVNESVRVLYVNPNDGNLYMGGEFPELIDGNAGVVDFNMSGIAMYDGSDWTPLGTGLNEYCRAIHEYNGDLIAGGYFTTAGGVSANKIAKWNGTSWSAMGGGFDGGGIDEYVKSAMSWNGTFFAGGAYTQAEGGPMNYIAQWYEAPTNSPTSVISSTATGACAGNCIDFNDNSTNSPTSWIWSFPGGSPSTSTNQNPGSVCFSSAGNYTIELIACNSNGCDTSTMDITIGTIPTITANNPNICEGDNVTLTATPSAGGGDFLWGPGGETTSSIVVSPTATTSYTIDYTLNGCSSATFTSTVTVSPLPTVNVNNASICDGDNVTLTATPSASGGTYAWTPGGSTSSTISISPSSTTTYSVIYSLSGCPSSPAISNVTVNPTFNLNENMSACNGETVTYPDGTSETVTTNTSHTSSLMSAAGCDSIIITSVSINPSYSIPESINVCSGDDYTYPDGTSSTNITADESHTSSLSSVFGCDSLITTSLTVIQPINTSQAVEICSGNSYTYPDGTTSSNITVNESHTSTLSSSTGCDSVIVTSISVVSVINTTQSVSVCEGESYTYPDGTISTNILVDESHTSMLVSSGGCDSIIVSNITVNALPTVTVNSETICEGESVALTATPSAGGGDYLWNPGGETASSIVVSPTSTTTYSVVYTLNGCESNSMNSSVTVNALPITATTTSGNTITSDQSNGVYQWIDCDQNNSPITNETNQSYTASTNGNYAAIIDLNGCIDTTACVEITGLGIDENLNAPFVVYPNPAESTLYFNSDLDLNGSEYVITDVLGRSVLVGTISSSNKVNISQLARGRYNLQINRFESSVISFIKK